MRTHFASSARQRVVESSARRVAFVALMSGLMLVAAVVHAQGIDLLLKGGHVIDPRNGIAAPMDVAITGGRVSGIAVDIPASPATLVVDVRGLYVAPGFIDLH